MVLYIDDGIVAAKSFEGARSCSATVRETLDRAGLVVNSAKSVWEPVRVLQWLGFTIDLDKGVLSVPKEKIDKLKEGIVNLMRARNIKAKGGSQHGRQVDIYGAKYRSIVSPNDPKYVCINE